MDVSSWLRDLGLAELRPGLPRQRHRRRGAVAADRRGPDRARRQLDRSSPPAARCDRSPPSMVRRRLLRSRSTTTRPVEAERRQLTVLFCDLVGSTELAARLDPEDLREVMRAYQRCLRRRGRAASTGTSPSSWATACSPISAGRKRTRTMPSGRCAPGLSWSRRSARLDAHAGSARSQARVGIATGLVVVGDLIGEGAAREEAVVGEVPNLAARLQALAEPGTVVIGQATRRLVGGLFELDDLGPQRLKGFAEPLAAWRVAGEGRAEGRFEARQTARLTPLVGREEELALLLRRWRQARDGEGQVVLLSGEPGHRQVAPRARAARTARAASRTSACSTSARPITRPARCTRSSSSWSAPPASSATIRPRPSSTSSRRCWRAARTGSIRRCR